MVRLSLFSICILLFCSMLKPNCRQGQSSIDSLFVNWNEKSLASLDRQITLSTDSVKTSAYKNRLLAIKAYLDVATSKTVNVNSIRYKFLRELIPHQKSPEFYVIEANESGQKILLQNFVVYPTGSSAKVDYYINEGSWRKSRSFDIQNFVLNENLKNFLTKKGFNEDDVIISKFDNGEIKASEYFLYGTLSTSSGVKTILDNHEK